MNNFVLIILDGVGVGELPDADEFNDSGSNTLGNLSRAVNGLELPNLQGSGLGNIIDISGVSPVSNPNASYGKLAEISKGKDSTTGHWEIAGLFVNTEFSYFPKGFPDETIKTFLNKTGCKNVLGNKAASGTEIIDELGEEHIKTGYPIVYTSADSVFQIAAHEKVIQLDELYKICEITRNEVLIDPVKVGRVIARPFVGEPGNFKRTTNRKDFSIDPPSATLLDVLRQNGIKTIAIGKVNDLFNYRGITESVNTKSNNEGIRKIIEAISQNTNSFIFANLVDFDVYFGHRNDPEGFKKELEKFDKKLPEILNSLDKSDALIITADHGNDPTTPSTDHSREYIPLIFYRKNRSGKNLGTRETFSDIAQTVCSFYKVDNYLNGKSFLDE